jgi:YebC/PmpR family DNA-binding regulatory protein
MGRAAAVRANTKAKTDAKKAKTNAIFGKKIIMAVKDGGDDPQNNRLLGDLIKQAKAQSVPMENIQRAIKRATEGSGGDFKEGLFEAYGHGGASLVINVLTDNNNRATSDVRSVVGKREGKMAEQGSVIFMYDKRGLIELPSSVTAESLNEEALLEAAIEAGCDDYELVLASDVEGTSVIYTDPKEVGAMMEAVKALGFEDNVKMSLTYVSKAPVEVSDKDFEKNMEIIEALEDLDDVDSVQHNMVN